MKFDPSFRAYLRIGAAVTLISVGAAMAFVAANPSRLSLLGDSGKKHVIDKFRQDRDQFAGNRQARPGPDREGGPLAAAEEDYAHRAYPAADVPMKATQAAQKAWSNLKALQEKHLHGPFAPAATAWSLVGPSTANFPDVLTFSGTPYTTSGRITAIAIDPACNTSSCQAWVGAAGGGVWRTPNVLAAGGPTWTFVSGSFATNAIGTLKYDAGTATLYAGTGEPNASGDSEAGLGVYKSTDGGNSWTLLASTVGPITTTSPGTGTNGTYTGNAFVGRAISSVNIDPTNPNHLYVASARAVRGVSSVGGATSNPSLARPPFGLFESTNGGATFNFIWDGGDGCPAVCDGTNTKATIRGVNRVELDPGWNGTTNKILYGGAFGPNNVVGAGGVWRSLDGGSTWTQIKSARNVALSTDRAEFAVADLGGGNTRMYVGIGNSSTLPGDQARLYRSDSVAAGTPTFTDMTALESPAGQSLEYCHGQCWYDNVVYSPPGKPDVVYLGGSFDYAAYGGPNNGRAFLRSTDAGVSYTDMTWDATTNVTPPNSCCQPNPISPNGQHPDTHALVEVPGSDIAIFGTDGGLMRSSGAFANISSQCTSPRGLIGTDLSLCQQLLASVPALLSGVNAGLSTMQFQSVSVAADNPAHIQGGTQDNGTFETLGSTVWPQIIYGDGGQSGFNVGNSALRLNTFTGKFNDVNFQNGDPTKWVIASGPIAASTETALFYPPIIPDPNPSTASSIFQGSLSVWRTQDWAGNQVFLEANCPEFTTAGNTPTCGDFVAIGPAGATRITVSFADYRGTTRAGGNVAALARTTSDTSTLWAATSLGRVFISKNADNATANAVTYTRLDTLDVNSPARFITAIYVDRANSNHAWIAYNGYNFNTPSQPGHIFSVTYNPGGGTATWTNIDGAGAGMFPDFPATSVVADSNGDVYAANDWGVLRLPNGAVDWEVAGTGLPQVEVPGLTIMPGARLLYAATHGRSNWTLALPLQLVGVDSRKTHGGAGTFDINMPLTGSPGIECRQGSGNYTIVFHLTSTLLSGAATVTAHNPGGAGGTVSGTSFSGSDMIVSLTGVTDAQVLTITLTSVTGTNGATLPSTSVNLGFLVGDTTADGSVNSGDISQTKSQSGQPVTISNFREDVVIDGLINSADISLVKSQSGSALP